MTYTLTRKSYLASNGIPILIDSFAGPSGTTHSRNATLPGSGELFSHFVFRKITGQHEATDPELCCDPDADLTEEGWKYILGVSEVPRHDIPALLALLASAGCVPQRLLPLVAPRRVFA
jgi:hypothetical protein